MSSKPYDVVLIPEADVALRAIEVSRVCQLRGTHFTLDGETFFPHLSLYMLQLSDREIQNASRYLSTISSETYAIYANAINYNYESEYLDVEYYRSPELISLQKKVVGQLNPLRDGLRDKDVVRLATATGEERENILQYGYRSIGNQFHPHLTFTRFKARQDNVIETLPQKSIFTGKYDSLAIFEMGENGTCTKLVGSWKLKN